MKMNRAGLNTIKNSSTCGMKVSGLESLGHEKYSET